MFYERSPDYKPVFWCQGYPVYLTTLLVTFHVAGFIALVILTSLTLDGMVLPLFWLNAAQVWTGGIWRIFTYVLLDPPSVVPRQIWYLPVSMYFLHFAGRQVEEFIGRKFFAQLYLALLLIPALFLVILGGILPVFDGVVIGFESLIFGVFIALATLYPGMQLFCLPITLYWWAVIGLLMKSILYTLYHDNADLVMTWISAGTAYFFLRFHGAGRGFDWVTDAYENWQSARLARRHKMKVLKKVEKERSLDEILEKISLKGVASLTASEKAVLERTRTELINRDKGR